jgi:hypothetical protein
MLRCGIGFYQKEEPNFIAIDVQPTLPRMTLAKDSRMANLQCRFMAQ